MESRAKKRANNNQKNKYNTRDSLVVTDTTILPSGYIRPRGSSVHLMSLRKSPRGDTRAREADLTISGRLLCSPEFLSKNNNQPSITTQLTMFECRH